MAKRYRRKRTGHKKSFKKRQAKIRRSLYDSSMQYVKATEVYDLTTIAGTGGTIGIQFQVQLYPTNFVQASTSQSVCMNDATELQAKFGLYNWMEYKGCRIRYTPGVAADKPFQYISQLHFGSFYNKETFFTVTPTEAQIEECPGSKIYDMTKPWSMYFNATKHQGKHKHTPLLAGTTELGVVIFDNIQNHMGVVLCSAFNVLGTNLEVSTGQRVGRFTIDWYLRLKQTKAV